MEIVYRHVQNIMRVMQTLLNIINYRAVVLHDAFHNMYGKWGLRFHAADWCRDVNITNYLVSLIKVKKSACRLYLAVTDERESRAGPSGIAGCTCSRCCYFFPPRKMSVSECLSCQCFG